MENVKEIYVMSFDFHNYLRLWLISLELYSVYLGLKVLDIPNVSE